MRRVMGIETEYGIVVPGDPGANPMVASGDVVTAYAASRGIRPGPGELGLRRRGPAARRARLRHGSRGRAPEPAHRRRGPHARQRRAHQRRPALRRPRPPRVQLAGGHEPPRRRPVGPRRRARHARGRRPALHGAAGRQPLQEQHRRQGRLVRHPRELPHGPLDPVREHRAAPHAVLRRAPGDVRLGARRHRGRLAHPGLPARPAQRLLRGRGGARDDAQAADHQHPRRAPRRRRPLPPPARHPRRRQPLRRREPAQDGQHLARPRDDRGRRDARRPLGAPPRRDPARGVARPHASRPRSSSSTGAG